MDGNITKLSISIKKVIKLNCLLFAKKKRVIVKKEDLKNKGLWVRGWDSKVNKNNRSSLMDRLVDGTISRGQAAREVLQITRRKAEQRLLDNSNEKEELL